MQREPSAEQRRLGKIISDLRKKNAELERLIKEWREQALREIGGLPDYLFTLNTETDEALSDN